MSKILDWAQKRWLPSGKVDISPAQVRRIALVVHFIAYLLIPFYQIDQVLRLKYKRRGILRSTLRSELEMKGAKYMHLVRSEQDEDGFIMYQEGDSLLFSGLAGAAGVPVNITAARDEHSGQWFRRPLAWGKASSASTISRDMLIGLLWYCWRKQRLDILEDLWQYGKDHNWVMGEGDASRILLMPPLQGTLALMIAKLGGAEHFQRFNVQVWNSGLTGFQAHLQVLHIMLLGEIEGQIDGSMWSRIREHANREPNNPLFTAAEARYIKGNLDDCELSLSNEQWWPTNRLPREDDRSEPWLPQRDYGDDWKPGLGTRQWSGCDFLFCLSL